jgi:hypothetical protein
MEDRLEDTVNRTSLQLKTILDKLTNLNENMEETSSPGIQLDIVDMFEKVSLENMELKNQLAELEGS